MGQLSWLIIYVFGEVIMVKRAFKIKMAAATAAVLLLALSLCVPAFAADNEGNPGEQPGSITVTLTEQSETHKAVAGAALILHKVGNIKEGTASLSFAPVPAFEGSGLDFEDLRAEGLAKNLAEYALTKDIEGTMENTDARGLALFDGFAPGLYLVMQETPAPGYYPIAPFLVSVPMISQDGTGWIYDVDASPKVEPVPDKPAPPPPVTPESPPMIQTGQLSWPVPVLAIAGMLLFASGWALTYLKDGKDPEKQDPFASL